MLEMHLFQELPSGVMSLVISNSEKYIEIKIDYIQVAMLKELGVKLF